MTEPQAGSPPTRPIRFRYLLLTFIPYYQDDRGGVWLSRLWHHDFVEHLRYIENLTLAAPRLPKDHAPADVQYVEVPPGTRLELVALPLMRSTWEALIRTPALACRLWDAVGKADIVHSGVAGWPYPIGWVANAFALVRRRKLLINVESAPWRFTEANAKLKDRVRAVVTEVLARFFVRRADVSFFSQLDYRRTLARPTTRHCHLTPASWITEDDILPVEAATASWDSKAKRPVELLFAARLVPVKGVRVLLDALAALDRERLEARVTVIGQGPLEAECREAASRLRHVRLILRPPAPYGAAFPEVVRAHHLMLVPSLGDEQPRILFDASAQAVGVIASNTDGIRPHVRDGETGWLVPTGDAKALGSAIARATTNPKEVRSLGLAAHAGARQYMHRGMHETRWRILLERFG